MPEGDLKLLTVFEALSGVMGEVQSVGKDSRNTNQNYNFRGVDAVVNAVGPALRRWNVIVVPTKAEYDAEHFTAKSGGQMRGVTVKVTFRFYGPAGDYIEAEALGESADAGDKAIPKAHSVAYRTLLLQALCIPTDEPDPDSASVERGERREDTNHAPDIPRSWAKVKETIAVSSDPKEAWKVFEAYIRAASYHLYGETDSKKLTAAQRKVILQKAAGAAVALVSDDSLLPPFDGPPWFGVDEQRQAWASVLEGTMLEIPDYKPPEKTPAEQEAEAIDEEAARMAAETFADMGAEPS